MAEREPPDLDALRQAREKLCRHGFTGLFHAVFATSLFVQSLEAAIMEISNWVEQRGARRRADNIRGALDTIDKNE